MDLAHIFNVRDAAGVGQDSGRLAESMSVMAA
jgi:hypothetical protein